MNNNFIPFKRKIMHPVYYRMFLFWKLPAAFFAGLKIESLDEQTAVVSVKYKWFNKNPFNSIYFAVLNMEGELSTGVLCMGMIYGVKTKMSMLVIKTEAEYYKKAVGKIRFTCNDGEVIRNAVKKAIDQNEPQSVRCASIGSNEKGEKVAEVWITWSFKLKMI
ncbi:MAG: hypothetical protein JWN76_1834 [Chitinophagaceae bacterium]|nr:hypothetical protein [Chitinophagaceae bacterium]